MYERVLRRTIRHPIVVIVAALAIFLSSLQLLNVLAVEYMPREDRAFAMMRLTAPDGASLEYTMRYIKQAEQIAMRDRESGDAQRVISRSGSWGGGADVNTAMVFSPLQTWDKRERSAAEIVQNWNRQLADLPGVQAFAFAPGAWSLGQSSRPLQIVLGGTDYDELAQWRDTVMAEAAQLPGLSNLQSDYRERKPKIDVSI